MTTDAVKWLHEAVRITDLTRSRSTIIEVENLRAVLERLKAAEKVVASIYSQPAEDLPPCVLRAVCEYDTTFGGRNDRA